MERKKLFFFFLDFILTDHDMNLDHQQDHNFFEKRKRKEPNKK